MGCRGNEIGPELVHTPPFEAAEMHRAIHSTIWSTLACI